MKNKKTLIIAAIILILLFFFNKQIFFQFQKFQHLITKKFIYYLKHDYISYWIFFIFLYGVFHSIGPGHGKVYLLSLSAKYDKKTLLLYSAGIAYFQGLISFLFVYFFIKLGYDYNIGEIRHVDAISKNTYGLTLIFLASINLLGEFLETKMKDKFLVLGIFFPCSGLLTLLLAVTLLGYKQYLFVSSLVMASGMFVTLAIFSLILNKAKVNELTNHEHKHFSSIFYILILLLGIYVVYR